jgi:hypothetical protein
MRFSYSEENKNMSFLPLQLNPSPYKSPSHIRSPPLLEAPSKIVDVKDVLEAPLISKTSLNF